jgi:Cu+-exporting ATPase
MIVDPDSGGPDMEHEGRLFHFCSAGCREKFAASPDAFIDAKDPVCGMAVDRASAEHVQRHDGETFYFCSASCRDKFAAAPETYAKGSPKRKQMPTGTQYTCPMHPQIVRDAPGDCPICGLALEPMGVPTGDEGPNPVLVDFTRRF